MYGADMRKGTRTWPRWAGLVGAVALALGTLLPLGAHAAERFQMDLGPGAGGLPSPDALVGEWLAVTRLNGLPQPVRLQIHTVEPGKTAGKLIYSSPRRCVIDLEYGGPDEDRYIFYIIPFTNCFDYQRTDFVALWVTEAEASSGRLPLSDKGAKPAGGEKPPARIRYAVSLNKQETEAGFLRRK